MAGRGDVALALRGVTVRFRDGARAADALSSVSLEVPAGACVALLGPSGAGKSTLLAVCAALLAPDEGALLWRGEAVSAMREFGRAAYRRAVVGAALQTPMLLDGVTVRANLAAQRRPVDLAAVEALGVAPLIDRDVARISGGERQRVALARAVGTGAALILLDEPSAALDDGGVAALAGLLRARVSGGAAALVATHDPRLRTALEWDEDVVLRGGARTPPEVP